MDRSLTILFAILLFLGGAVAGRLIQTPDLQPMTTRPVSDPLTETSPPETPAAPPPVGHHNAVRNSAAGDIQFAGFEQPIETPEESLTTEEIRREITQRFPDLPEETVEGWVEAYRDSNITELRNLLNERQQLSDLFPVRSFLSETSNALQSDTTLPSEQQAD